MDLVAWRFEQETRTAFRRVPVVIDKMMKTRLGDRAARWTTLGMVLPFERYYQIEVATRRLTATGRDHTRVIFTFRNADAAFVRMRRKVLDPARSVLFVPQQLVKRLDGSDLLVITVTARVVVGPRDGRRVAVVGNVTRLIRIEVVAVKEMGAADAA